MHAWDPVTPLEETLRTLGGFVTAGKIGYYGLSNFTGWQLTKAVHLARALGVPGPVTLQPQYSLIVREIEWEVVPAVLDAGMGLLPWSPLGGGWLSGKYSRDSRPTGDTRLGEDPNRGMEAWDRRGTDRTWAIIDAVQKVAEDRGVSMAEVALAWVTDRPGGDLDHPGRAYGRAAGDEPEGRRPAPDAGGDGCAGRGQRPGGRRLPVRDDGPGPAQPCRSDRSRLVVRTQLRSWLDWSSGHGRAGEGSSARRWNSRWSCHWPAIWSSAGPPRSE